MFERLNTPSELFNLQLGAALTMERDIVEMLDELISEAPEESIKEALRAHQQETRAHVSNVEEAFKALGWEVDDSPCPAIKGIEKEGKANIKKADEALVGSVILEGAMETEHHEIGVYENLIIHARALGHEQVARLLEQNLQQEEQALQNVKHLAQSLATAHTGMPVG
jgi:ferritin-like metal-binding protein YciE